MTTDQSTVFAILVLTIILFIWNRWRYDLVAMGALGASVLTNVVPFENAFTGFSNPAVITVAAIFVLSAAISQSGFTDLVLKFLSPLMKNIYLQILILSVMIMVFSAFMNNIGALAIFLPLAINMARKSGYSPAQLLMPLSFASLLGGLVTLIGTPPNLLISNIRMQYTQGEPYSMFDFAPVGIGLCLAGLLYLTISWRLVPAGRKGKPLPEDMFEIEDYVSEVFVENNASIAGKTIREIENNFDDDLEIISLIRNGSHIPKPARQSKVKAGDNLLVLGDPSVLKKFVDTGKVSLVSHNGPDPAMLHSDDISVCEAVVTGGAQIIGLTAREANLRRRFGLNLLAVKKSSGRKHQRLKNVRFREGDIIVLQGETDIIAETLKELGCLPLAERNLLLGRQRHIIMTPAIMAMAVMLTALNILPAEIAFSGAVLLVAITKTMRMDEIYESINWPIIILLGALIPVTEALQTTGGDELIADILLPLAKQLPGTGLVALVLVASMLVTPFLNNAAAVLVMAPIAASMAIKAGYNIDPFMMAVAVGASCDFLTPVGHQSNTLVFGPGGYKFTDYFRLGFLLSLIVIAAGVPLITIVWPLQ